MRKARNILSPMHLETTRLKATSLHIRGGCLVVVWAVIHFKPYFYGIKFTLYTDHQPAKWLMTNDKLIGKLVHWVLIFQEYEFKVIHRLGVTHQNADTMSRRPSPPLNISQKLGKISTKF
jgi:hypothetical protein